MSGVIHANPADLRKFAKALRSAEGEVNALCARLTSTMNSLDWRDSVKDRVDADVNGAVKGLQRFGAQLSEHARTVDKKASQGEAFLNH